MTFPVGRYLPDWVPARLPPRTPLRGRLVSVMPFDAESVPGLWDAFAGDDEMWTYMGYGPFASRADMEATVEGWPRSDDPRFVVFEVEGTPVGWGSYLRIDPPNGSIEVGHLAFSSRLRRTAAATEAMYLMAQRAFDELGYRRYEWKCDALNRPSRAAADRLGFAYEGTFRNHMVAKGRNRDTAWYSIIDSEWPRVRSALEAWLEPANHRGGSQLRRLADIRAEALGDAGGRPAPAGGDRSQH